MNSLITFASGCKVPLAPDDVELSDEFTLAKDRKHASSIFDVADTWIIAPVSLFKRHDVSV